MNIRTTPASVEMAAAATIAPGIDFAAVLTSGETVGSASATLRNLTSGVVVTRLPTPTVSGTLVITVLDGAALGFHRGETYELVVVANVSATKKPGRVLEVRVVA